MEGEELYMYLFVIPNTISFVLVGEDVGVQKPIYYTSKRLYDVEIRYTNVEKMIYVLVITTK